MRLARIVRQLKLTKAYDFWMCRKKRLNWPLKMLLPSESKSVLPIALHDGTLIDTKFFIILVIIMHKIYYDCNFIKVTTRLCHP